LGTGVERVLARRRVHDRRGAPAEISAGSAVEAEVAPRTGRRR
jgi:hypothetical protein